MTECASLIGCSLPVCAHSYSPELHLTGDAARVGSPGGRRLVKRLAASWGDCVGSYGGFRGRLTGPAVGGVLRVVGGKKDPPSNHLWETEVWEDNYKYSCQRRHVSIDALEWDQQRLQEASGRGIKTRHEKSVCREQLIKSLLSLYVLILFA